MSSCVTSWGDAFLTSVLFHVLSAGQAVVSGPNVQTPRLIAPRHNPPEGSSQGEDWRSSDQSEPWVSRGVF